MTMTEKQLRELVVTTAQGFLGAKQGDARHKKIIDIYNADKPLPRGYTMMYIDPWCACTISTVSIMAKLTDIIPKEVSCGRMIDLYKKLGRWQESDALVPLPGDILFYDWDDEGKGDCTGAPEHVGMVDSVHGTVIKVIEGNISKAVGYRNIQINARYIRGYGLPDYASKASMVSSPAAVTLRPAITYGMKGDDVRAVQKALISAGFSVGGNGADGSFGPDTLSAVKELQKARGLAVDGSVGPLTQKALGLK